MSSSNAHLRTHERINPIWISDRALWEKEPDQVRLNRAANLLKTAPEQALLELQALAAIGSILSMVYLGHAFRNGTGTSVDLVKSEERYRRASDGGSALAAGILGVYYFDAKNYPMAETFVKIGKERKYLPAAFRLAIFYLDGESIRPQPDKARELLEEATALGHIVAKRRLGGLLVRGGFGLFQRLRGLWLILSSLVEGGIVAATDFESDRLRG